MWDTVQVSSYTMSHDMPCPHCGHARHVYLPCSDECICTPPIAFLAVAS